MVTSTHTPAFSTLSLHDALPILALVGWVGCGQSTSGTQDATAGAHADSARPEITLTPADSIFEINDTSDFLHVLITNRSEEHTLNSSHLGISYAVFCLKKKKRQK